VALAGAHTAAGLDAELRGATIQWRNRMSVALCDFPVGKDLSRMTLTCDAPICAKHRTSVGPSRDHCPRRARQQKLPEIEGHRWTPAPPSEMGLTWSASVD
jgi:hypothetical protein